MIARAEGRTPLETMLGRRFARTAWLVFAGAVAASCGGDSTSRTGGEVDELACPNVSPSEGSPCGGDLVGTWTASACSLTVSGVVDLRNLGLSPDCTSPPVTGSLRVTGTVTFHEDMTYSDETTTSGESTFELVPECTQMAATCEVLQTPLLSLGFASLTCVTNAVNGCTCTGTILQTGGLALVVYDPSTSGTYTTGGDDVTLTSDGVVTTYSYCVLREAKLLTLSPQTAGINGTVADPIVLVKP
jgi:hypothetical protein